MVPAHFLIGFFVCAAVSATFYALTTRSRSRRAQRTTRELAVSPLSGLVLGAMFAGFQAIVQPGSRHSIVEEQREESFYDRSGHEPPGGLLFVQQLRQIRAGAEVEELIVQAEVSGGEAGTAPERCTGAPHA